MGMGKVVHMRTSCQIRRSHLLLFYNHSASSVLPCYNKAAVIAHVQGPPRRDMCSMPHMHNGISLVPWRQLFTGRQWRAMSILSQ